MKHKISVTKTLSSIENETIEIRPFDIEKALKSVNKGKACGVDGLAAEYFIYADERIHVILSILFNWSISHGYLQWRSEGNWRPGAKLNFVPPPPPPQKNS